MQSCLPVQLKSAACIQMNAEYFSRVWEEIAPALEQFAQNEKNFEILSQIVIKTENLVYIS